MQADGTGIMPMTYSIDSTRRVVFTTASGVLADRDILAHKEELLADPKLEPGMMELQDVRGITKVDVTSKGIQHLAVLSDSEKKILGDFKLAIVVSKSLAFGMARVFEAYAGDSLPHVSVFRDMDSAKAWLEIS